MCAYNNSVELLWAVLQGMDVVMYFLCQEMYDAWACMACDGAKFYVMTHVHL